MNGLRVVSMLVVCAALQGCGLFGGKEEPPPPPPPTRVALKIEAAADINPDASGQGAPLQLRIYELRGTSAFDGADFFAIYDHDQASLGADLASKKELVLKPGEGRMLMLEPAAGSQYVAAFAAYRQLDDARWRASIPIIEHRTTVVDIKISGTRMTMEVAPVAPLPAR
jgi:type VI secretion system protein VasD